MRGTEGSLPQVGHSFRNRVGIPLVDGKPKDFVEPEEAEETPEAESEVEKVSLMDSVAGGNDDSE